MATALQKQLDALFASFSAELIRLIRESSPSALAADGAAPEPITFTPIILPPVAPRATIAPAPAPRAAPAAVAVRAPTRRERTHKAAPTRATPRASVPRASVPLEDIVLEHLEGGALLTLDAVLAFGHTPAEGRSALERLAARGAIGFSGDESDRFVFARVGKPQPTAVPWAVRASGVTEVLSPARAPVEARPAPVASTPAAPPAPPPSEPGRHPFVVRRKKASAAS